jgi:DNA-binding transcriptional LysR family regulator
MLDWSDLRHFLAVARTGSTLAASRELGVNQTTCARRIAALEEVLGMTLFERGREGYRLVDRARELVPAAERVEAEVKAFLDDAAGAERRLSGTIKVTTNEPLANIVLARAVADFRAAYPRVRVELLVGDAMLDIARGEADVALRVGTKPTDPCLVARQLAVAGWAVYCSREYARLHGSPSGVGELSGHPLLTLDRPVADWVVAVAPGAEVACRSNSLPNLCAMLKAGLGISGLPCIVGDMEAELQRCFPLEAMQQPVWLVYHERLRGQLHVRAFLDFLSSHVLAKRALLMGERPNEQPSAAKA